MLDEKDNDMVARVGGEGLLITPELQRKGFSLVCKELAETELDSMSGLPQGCNEFWSCLFLMMPNQTSKNDAACKK